MNILEFVSQGGKIMTATGDHVLITDINPSTKYCISGKIDSTVYDFNLSWDENGYPERLPLTHGLNLLAILPEIKYTIINKQKLKEAKTIDDLSK